MDRSIDPSMDPNIEKINWKLFIDRPESVATSDFFKVFNTWIPNSPEIFVDVADYAHVHDGPLTVLVGHYVDYCLDAGDRRLGLLYNCKRKRRDPGQAPVSLESSLAELFTAAKRLCADPVFQGKLAFKGDELSFLVNDRALAPNTAATFRAFEPGLNALCTALYSKGAYTLTPVNEPKQRFRVTIKNTAGRSIDDCLKRLAGPAKQ